MSTARHSTSRHGGPRRFILVKISLLCLICVSFAAASQAVIRQPIEIPAVATAATLRIIHMAKTPASSVTTALAAAERARRATQRRERARARQLRRHHHVGGLAGAVTTTTVVATTTTSSAASTSTISPTTTTTVVVVTKTATQRPASTTTVHHPTATTVAKSTPKPTTTTATTPTTTTTTTTAVAPPQASTTPYPLGISNSSEPSGMAPPAVNAFPGYTQTYVNDFTGSSLPSDWSTFAGQPGGDPGAQWAPTHVSVGGGLLQLNTSQDPAYGNAWVAGGVCRCGHSQIYGAYFIRSRTTGPGPTVVQLLWPAAKVWPPEIDFNESDGTTGGTTATVHFGSSNNEDHRSVNIDITQWHTWGVIWTPSSITYTLDGQVWGTVSVPSEIPNQAMTLDIDQQTWCSSGMACPTAPQSQLIDWTAEYTAH